MTDDDWNDVVASLRQVDDLERMVAAAQRLEREAKLTDVPRSRALLDDPSVVVREAAAFPLAYLLGPGCLRELLVAATRGTREGLDNDTLDAAIVEVLSLDGDGARTALGTLSHDSDLELGLAARAWLERL